MKVGMLLLFVSLASSTAFGQTPPSQAVAAGYTNLTFDDEFNSPNTVSPDGTGNYNWYRTNFIIPVLLFPPQTIRFRTATSPSTPTPAGMETACSPSIRKTQPTRGLTDISRPEYCFANTAPQGERPGRRSGAFHSTKRPDRCP